MKKIAMILGLLLLVGLAAVSAIVQVEAPVQLDGKWALVMDLVTGASVQRLTSLGAMPPSVATEIVQGHKIPAIVDPNGPGGQRITLCESGAILKYLGEKANNGLYPSDPIQRLKVDQWLFYGSATFTTLAQQYGFFWLRNPEVVPAAKKHYEAVLHDMLGTLDTHLATNDYVAGAYSVADISMYPDVHLHGVNDIGLGDYPNVKRWHDAIAARPAVQKAWGPHE